MFDITEDQAKFHAALEAWAWYGDMSKTPDALHWVDGLRFQDGFVVLELVDNEGTDDALEYAISLDKLIDWYCEDFLRFSHPVDMAESKTQAVAALRRAIDRIEAQESDIRSSRG